MSAKDIFAEGEAVSSSRRELAASASSALPSGDGDRALPQSFPFPCARLGHWCAGWNSCNLMFHASPGAVIRLWAPRLCARGKSRNAVGFCGRHLHFAAFLLCHQNLLATGCYEAPVEPSWKLHLGASGSSSGYSLPDSRCVTHLPYTITITLLFPFLTIHSVGVTKSHPFCGIFAEGAPLGKFIQQTKRTV